MTKTSRRVPMVATSGWGGFTDEVRRLAQSGIGTVQASVGRIFVMSEGFKAISRETRSSLVERLACAVGALSQEANLPSW